MREATEFNINWFYGAKPIYGMWCNASGTIYYSCSNIIRGKFIVVSFSKNDNNTFTPTGIFEYTFDEFNAIAPENVVKECIRIYS